MKTKTIILSPLNTLMAEMDFLYEPTGTLQYEDLKTFKEYTIQDQFSKDIITRTITLKK